LPSETKRVGLFGGSFDPPHICHLLSSIYLLETTDLSAIWWLPVHRHAFRKGDRLASWESRLAMCSAVAEQHRGIEVEPIEAELGPTNFAIDTIGALRDRHPETEFSWIIGSDLLEELPRWHRWPELRDSVRFVVVGRGPADALLPEGGRFDLRDFTLPDVSSTQVRRLLAAGRDGEARRFVPGPVASWLEQHPEHYR